MRKNVVKQNYSSWLKLDVNRNEKSKNDNDDDDDDDDEKEEEHEKHKLYSYADVLWIPYPAKLLCKLRGNRKGCWNTATETSETRICAINKLQVRNRSCHHFMHCSCRDASLFQFFLFLLPFFFSNLVCVCAMCVGLCCYYFIPSPLYSNFIWRSLFFSPCRPLRQQHPLCLFCIYMFLCIDKKQSALSTA